MLSGATWSASETAGTAVFRIVVSSDSMKNATATSQGNKAVPARAGAGFSVNALGASGELITKDKHAANRGSPFRASRVTWMRQQQRALQKWQGQQRVQCSISKLSFYSIGCLRRE